MFRLAVLFLLGTMTTSLLGASAWAETTDTGRAVNDLAATYAATTGERGLIYFTLVGIIIALLIRDFLKDRAFRLIGREARAAAELMSNAMLEASRRNADAIQALLIAKAVEEQARARQPG